jgi:hypothetical protein
MKVTVARKGWNLKCYSFSDIKQEAKNLLYQVPCANLKLWDKKPKGFIKDEVVKVKVTITYETLED